MAEDWKLTWCKMFITCEWPLWLLQILQPMFLDFIVDCSFQSSSHDLILSTHFKLHRFNPLYESYASSLNEARHFIWKQSQTIIYDYFSGVSIMWLSLQHTVPAINEQQGQWSIQTAFIILKFLSSVIPTWWPWD